MKHLKLKIVFIIFISVLLIFAASFSIINIFLPDHFEKEAEKALLYETQYYENLYSFAMAAGEDSDDGLYIDEYTGTYFSGNINYLPLASEKLFSNAFSNEQTNTGRKSAENEIRNYCLVNQVEYNQCYTLKTTTGRYIFVKILDYFTDAVLYIDIQPIIQYIGLLNWILLAAFALVALVMCTIGVRLGGQIEAAQKTQQTFFQNASHELKTPLMSIQGYAEGIQTGLLPLDTAANVIMEESDRMTALVEELLTISKLDTCGISNNMLPCDMRDILSDCLMSIDPLLKKQGTSVEIDFSENPVTVCCDEPRLRRAFLNIFSNGMRYARSTLRVSCHAEKKYAVIRIQDDGCGIDNEDMVHIFDRFYVGKSGNIGIGLALTHEIISLHKGTIAAYNNGNGATFEIRLPLIK